MLPADWDEVLAPEVHWHVAYKTVGRYVRALLIANPQVDGDHLTTTALVELVYPEDAAKGEAGLKARKRFFSALATLAKADLQDCCTPGPTQIRFGKSVRPKLWHAPTKPVVKRCPHCGEDLL